jgi:hypothetical protein
MYRELTANNDIHVSHFMSKRFSVKREDRLWSHINDLNLTSKIEMRYNDSRGVQ